MNILFYVYRKSTPPAAAISGSMQLMAGVKLCTGRPITNHPHYEHKELRIKTKEVRVLFFIIFSVSLLTLNASIATKVVCFSRLL